MAEKKSAASPGAETVQKVNIDIKIKISDTTKEEEKAVVGLEKVAQSLKNVSKAVAPVKEKIEAFQKSLGKVGSALGLDAGLKDFIKAGQEALNSTDSLTDAQERAKGALSTLSENWSAFQGIIGENMLTVMGPFLEGLNGLLSFITEIASSTEFIGFMDQVAGLFQSVFGILGENLEPLKTLLFEFLAWMTEKLAELTKWLTEHQWVVEFIGAIVVGIIAVTAAFALFNTVTSIMSVVVGALTSPVTLVMMAIAALVAIVIMLVKHWDEVKVFAQQCWEKIVEIWNIAGTWFKEHVVAPISGFFNGLWDGIKTAFTTAWDFISGAFKGYINLWIGLVESFINFFIGAINMIIRGINSIQFTMPDWLGGKSIGFHLREVNKVSIPRLATGAVIPPNAEFAAILGDQKHGRNLETPEKLLRQIVRDESGKSGDLTVILQMPDGTQKKAFTLLGREREKRRIGRVAIPVEG